MSLNRVLKLAEALEAGKSNQEIVTGAGNLFRMSDHQKAKNTGRQEKRKDSRPANKPTNSSVKTPSPNKCGFCGSKSHTSKLSERRESCPAFAETCSGCGTVGHFKDQCRGGPRDKNRDRRRSTRGSLAEAKETKDTKDTKDDATTTSGELGSFAGSWFLLSGDQQQAGSILALQPQSTRKVQHMSFLNGSWRPSKLEEHGRVPITLKVCAGAAKSQGFPKPNPQIWEVCYTHSYQLI